jgi:hypothetical protein
VGAGNRCRGSPVPVTARLSKKFYETFGDDLTNELVEWLNQVDSAYHASIAEQFNVNFGRFDARLEQRASELRGEFTAGFARLDAKLEQRASELRGEFTAGFARFDVKLEQRVSELRSEFRAGLAELRSELLKWMFLFWLGTVGLVLSLAGMLRS